MRQKSKMVSTIVGMLLSLAIVLSGCGGGQAKQEPASTSADKSAIGSQSSTEAAKTGGVGNAEKEYTVKHAMGATTIKGTPKRVVVLTNEGTEAALSLGIKPIAIVKAWGMDPIYQHLTEQLKDVTIIGDENQPNLELIATLKPDLILGNKLRQEKVYEQLSRIAPTVFSERINGDWQINYKLYAEALNKKEEGNAEFAKFESKVSGLRTKLGDKINTAVSIVRFNPGGIVRIYYNDTFSGVLLKKIGLKRPAVQDQSKFADDVAKERIPDMEGDILFYFTYDNEKGEAVKAEQEWQKDPLWNNLNVVKKGKIHKVYDGIWNSSGGIISANLMLDDLEKYLLKN
ncbi:ABC transporter substrate-binding protein [Paenibacillus radicis (ex Xue et al. 2023)]|uniref:ABC transporter substrate-binding protein n=1 Tax=Paenibacillus radicis (ex Xue et al. 2023) TaxID=2972489 RepID=A0ABT1YK34_9BACL|nr:ABC transporter substrate-binding protein [Paenibacillus radicis (ex Xue et al. 2023)]MCR8633342.1 ABC transporter substrate-binding protein [Paenibacillus radicis (ex Xue et al. 2023)]